MRLQRQPPPAVIYHPRVRCLSLTAFRRLYTGQAARAAFGVALLDGVHMIAGPGDGELRKWYGRVRVSGGMIAEVWK